MATIKHGRSAYVNHRCRCDICCEANRQHSRQWSQKPEHKAKKAAYEKQRYQQPEFKARADELGKKWREANIDRCRENKARWKEGNRDRIKATRDRWRLKKQFGITPLDRQNMEDMQGGVCAICWREPTKGTVLVVDHCHHSGKVRGLLCAPCNAALGVFQDAAETLRRAMAYLEQGAISNVEG
jgi:hypothetical protein